VYSESFRPTTISDRLELVQLLVEAEADPTSVAVGFKGPQSSLATALDKLDFAEPHTLWTSRMQVGSRVE
jgi:hypothetical protein